MRKWIILILIISFSFILIFFSTNRGKYVPELELLYEGKMDQIEFGIGSNYNDIIGQWGNPDENVDFMGAILLVYNGIYFFINDNQVVGIYYNGEKIIYGTQIGMSDKQLEETLGKPNDTYISHYSELYTDDNLILNYKADKYMVNFEINPESKKIESISIWPKDSKSFT
ncbi:DUF4309 domain-containing protein [Aminipila sp.]|uniref:DUF4309 domain-containing protein n=1 Tax=Aminipila sp. TaxID=2060095 RepID=UPI0028A1DF5E|nr:DUF4309 domain-containing protein [Aminipila sp.]